MEGLETISNLHPQVAAVQKNLEDFTKKLNEAPEPIKVQTHQGYQYLPISVVEKDLDKVFMGLVQYECISYSHIFNEVTAHARIRVFHPIINQWLNYDGLGSAVIQQDKDTKVIDFMNYKKPNALQLTLPKAYAEAIKNAAKKIGKRFGADINRKFEDVYSPMESDGVTDRKPAKEKEPIVEISQEVHSQIMIAETIEQLTAIYNDNQELHTNPEFMKMLTNRKDAL